MVGDLSGLRHIYRDGLLEDTLPFWLPRCIDAKHGGYFTALDQDGTLLQTYKSVWFQGRMAWMLATLCRTVEPRDQWLEASRGGIEFINRHCDRDGRMFFTTSQEGRPLRRRRYVFSECFAIIALAAYGAAAGEPRYVEQAGQLLRRVLHYLETPGLLPPKTNPTVRPMRGLAVPMMLMVTCQELRQFSADPLCDQVIDQSIDEIERDFLKQEFRCLLETVGPNGNFIDNFDGRLVNPGHSIEVGWFILHEARRRGNDPRLVRLGTTIIDWSLQIGWDQKYGGLLYYRDCKQLPCAEYWHDMKFWWPHNEAIIAILLAWQVTGDAKYRQWHAKVHEWAYSHFPDRQHGEWFGYLHRDGSVSTRLKGNLFKGMFHLPRMQWYCWQLLDEIIRSGHSTSESGES